MKSPGIKRIGITIFLCVLIFHLVSWAFYPKPSAIWRDALRHAYSHNSLDSFLKQYHPKDLPEYPSTEMSPSWKGFNPAQFEQNRRLPGDTSPIDIATNPTIIPPLAYAHSHPKWRDLFFPPSITLDYPYFTSPLKAHTHGFTVFENLYLFHGKFIVVTSDDEPMEKWPSRKEITSKPYNLGLSSHILEPTEEDIQFIPAKLWIELSEKKVATRIEGTSLIHTGSGEYIVSYSNWWGEVVIGAWRIYNAAYGKFSSDGKPEELESFSRQILTHSENDDWTSGGPINKQLTEMAFPSMEIQDLHYWKKLEQSDEIYCFDKVVLINRWAAHYHSPLPEVWQKMTSSILLTPVRRDFWRSVRNNVAQSLAGHVPKYNRKVNIGLSANSKPVVVYFSPGRIATYLRDIDHDALLLSLKALDSESLIEFREVALPSFDVADLVSSIADATIMIGVHGEALTNQLWMPTTSKSSVIEIFMPEGFMWDNEVLARSLGHQYYSFWDDQWHTSNADSGVSVHKFNVPPNFYGGNITVNGDAVATLVRKILNGTEPPFPRLLNSPLS